jgi:hypothetical protein
MKMPWLASLGLGAALLGAQPGCAQQLNERERGLAVLAVGIGLTVGAAMLEGYGDACGPVCATPSRLPPR